MNTAQCCTGERRSGPLARRVGGAAVSLLPGFVVLLPKGPLCLAAWLTVTTGFGVSAAAVANVRELIVISWIAALALALIRILRRRASGRTLRWKWIGGPRLQSYGSARML